jgi:hypothetical protein
MLVCGGPGYVPPGTESCDHLDNDCDGQTDDGATLSAQCNRTFSPTSGCGLSTCPAYLCLPRTTADYCSGTLASGTNGGEAPRAAYAEWSGDFGRANYFRARVHLRDTSSDGLEPDGWVTFVLLPGREIGADGSVRLQPGGLPLLAASERGVALSLSGAGYAATLWRYRGTYWDIVDTVGMPAACSPVSTTEYGYTFEIINDGTHFIARVSRNGCGTVSIDMTPTGLWDDLYGSGPTAPRYNLGVIGDNDDNLAISVYEMYMERRVHLGDRNDCDGCM